MYSENARGKHFGCTVKNEQALWVYSKKKINEHFGCRRENEPDTVLFNIYIYIYIYIFPLLFSRYGSHASPAGADERTEEDGGEGI